MDDLTRGQLDSPDLGDVCNDVVTEVADRVGDSPTELDPPLYEVVDPDALRRLFAGRNGHSDQSVGQVEFVYCGCRVTVTSSGEVDVSSKS